MGLVMCACEEGGRNEVGLVMCACVEGGWS